MPVELGVVEQRYDAVKEVLDGGSTVTEVARRYGLRARACTTGSAPTASGTWADPVCAVWGSRCGSSWWPCCLSRHE